MRSSSRARRFILILLGAASPLLGWSCGPDERSIVPNLMAELQRQPSESPEDLYKFVHHAAMGNAHLLQHGDARLFLLQEWDEIVADSAEQLIVPLSPDGRVVRLNLRPCKARGVTPEQIWSAIERSAAAQYSGAEWLERWWKEVVEQASRGNLDIPEDVLRDYFEERRAEDFPAVHHSLVYEMNYQPSYRVLLREEVEKLGLWQAGERT